MFLAQISDTHLLPLKSHDPLSLQRAEHLERCVATINGLPNQPEAVVHTGDMINFGPRGSDRENGYGLAFEILSRLKAPFYPTVGNRDSRPEFIKQFLAPAYLQPGAPFCQYRIQLESADLVCVDTKSATRNIGASCPERVKQVEQLLQEDRDKPVFIFLHHPPARVEPLRNPLQFESIEQARAFSDLFDQYDNIVRILCGHTHRSDFLPMGKHQASTHPSLATDVRLDAYGSRYSGEPVFQLHELLDDRSVSSMSHFAEEHSLAECMSGK